MKIAAIGDEDTIVGLKFAGINGIVAEGKEASEALKKMLDEEIIIIITEKVADEIRNEIDEIRVQRSFPIIVEIPDKKGTRKRKDPIQKLIKRAVGVEIKKT